MNNKLRDRIIREVKSHIEESENFFKDNGILMPIRASVFWDSVGYADQLLPLLKKAEKEESYWSNKLASHSTPLEKWKMYKKSTDIIGYFGASRPGFDLKNESKIDNCSPVLFSYSICRGPDLLDFNKIKAQADAMNPKWFLPIGDDFSDRDIIANINGRSLEPFNPGIDLPSIMDSHMTIDGNIKLDEDSTAVFIRVFGMTLFEQYEIFKDRCERYFKQK